MVIFNGKKEAENILLDIKEKILEKKIQPVLNIIFVGEDSSSKLFIKNKKKAAKRIGIIVNCYKFKEDVLEDEIVKKIEEFNSDDLVDGIIVQLPLPKKLNTNLILSKVDPKKDVDGFHKINRDMISRGENPYFNPPLPSAVLLALKASAKDFKGKKVLVVANTNIFGETVRNFLKKEGIKASFVLKKKNHFLDIGARLRAADVVVTVCGCVKQLKGEMIKEGAILIDGGIIVLSNGKVVGDVDKKSVLKKVSFLSPVPGGLGPLTVAFLLKNVYLAAK